MQETHTIKGSCQCGAIAYEIDAISTPILFCHCRTCQKIHAAPYIATAGVLPEQFRWLKGEERLSQFASSPDKVRYFCSQCGTHLIAERAHAPYKVVRLATLDEDPGQRPSAHIWCEHDRPWLSAAPDLPAYPQWQPGRS